jgi:tetratricopeptide (TPR) repeat protein
MNKRRKPFNYFKILTLVGAIAFVMYFGVVLGPSVQGTFLPTPTVTRSPESFVTEAGQLFEQGKLPQAIASYEQAVRAMPNDASIYISLARTQVWAGKYKEAQTSAENALLLNPNNSTAHAVRGWALEAQRDFLAAETAIKRALELDPNNALAHAYYSELLADEYLDGSGPFDALTKMSEESKVALSLAPGMFESHRARGYVYEATGNYEDAIREYEAAVAINKNIADLHVSLGRNYRALGVYDKAVNSLTIANQLNPSDPTPLLYISRVYATVGEYAKAEQYAQQAVKTNPIDTALRGNLGVMYYRNFKYPESAAELALVVTGGKDADGVDVKPLELVANATRIAEYYFTYGLVLVKLNECGQALPIFQKLLSVVPTDEIAVFNANEGIRLCSEAAAVTPSPESGTPAPKGSGTPGKSPTVTPTVTPTP